MENEQPNVKGQLIRYLPRVWAVCWTLLGILAVCYGCSPWLPAIAGLLIPLPLWLKHLRHPEKIGTSARSSLRTGFVNLLISLVYLFFLIGHFAGRGYSFWDGFGVFIVSLNLSMQSATSLSHFLSYSIFRRSGECEPEGYLEHLCTQLFLSPVAVLERRVRMRGWRTPVLLAAAAGLPILLFHFRLHFLWPSQHLTPDEYLRTAAVIGHRLFLELMNFEALLILVLMPLLMSNSFAGERENGCWEALMLTPMSDEEILLGKLGTVLIFVLLLFCCAVPITAMSFILGGVSPFELLVCLLLIIISAAMQGILGLHTSLRASTVAISALSGYLAFACWFLLLFLLIAIVIIAPFALMLSICAAFLLTAVVEHILIQLAFRFTRHQILYLYFIIAGVLSLALTSVFWPSRYFQQLFTAYPFVVFTPIPALLNGHGEFFLFGSLWSIAYVLLHLFGIYFGFVMAVKQLRRLRQGYGNQDYWDMKRVGT